MARNRQYADRVNVIKMVKVNGKWPFARVVERNGRIIRDRVWIAGREEHHSEAATTLNGMKKVAAGSPWWQPSGFRCVRVTVSKRP